MPMLVHSEADLGCDLLSTDTTMYSTYLLDRSWSQCALGRKKRCFKDWLDRIPPLARGGADWASRCLVARFQNVACFTQPQRNCFKKCEQLLKTWRRGMSWIVIETMRSARMSQFFE